MSGESELDKIAAEAAALEAASAQPQAQPGAPAAPPVDPAQEWRDAVHQGCCIVISVQPKLAAEWTPDKLDALGDALRKCAERYGWTVAGLLGHPFVGLAFAGFPLVVSMVRVARADAEEKAAKAKEKSGGAQGSGLPEKAGNLQLA